jgi:outer membrane receptor for ferrienterochelin and colicins
MNYKTWMLLCGILITLEVAGQSKTISGSVKNADTNEALAGVSISIGNTGIITNKEGKFNLSLPDSASKLVISATGFQTDSLLVRSLTHYHIFLKPAFNHLNEVVVSGTMKAVSKLASPIPVEVYTPTFFKKNPTATLFESLNMVSGIQPQINCNVCNTGDIHINGLEGPYTMIMIDGMPIVSSLSTVYGLHGIPQSILQKVEVVKGPASTLYGSEAVAGLVNVITKDPATAPKLTTDIFATTLGEINTDIATRLSYRNASALFGVNYFHYWTPKDVNDDNFTDVTQQKRLSLFNKWSFNRKDKKQTSIALRYVNENRWGGELQWNKHWRGGDSIYGESIYTNRFELIGTYDLPVKKQPIRFNYSYNYHHQDSYYGITKYLASQHTGFAQLVWDGKIGKANLLAGIPLRYIWYDDNSPATADSLKGKNKPSVTYLPGVFLQNELSLNRLTVLSGIRYDHNSIHGGIFTPRLSFKYSLNSRNAIRLTGGSGYRVVNLFTEDHAALSGARDVVIAEDLKPEQSWNVNLNYNGWTSINGGNLTLDASAFYTYFTNQIVGDFFSDPQKIVYDNLKGHAVSKGLTTSIELALSSGFKMLTAITLMDVYRNETINGSRQKLPQLFAPKFSGNFSLSYNFKKAGIVADWTGKVNSPMYLPVVPNDFRSETSPWHCIMNLQLSKRFPHNLEIYGGAKNLLNFIPRHPILRPSDPFDKQANDPLNNPHGYTFDPSYNYAPIQGLKGFLGFRWTVN